jgi:hypothetical protein
VSTELPIFCESCGTTGTIDVGITLLIENPCPSCSGKLSIRETTLSNQDFFQEIGHISVFFATLDFFVSILIDQITINPQAISLAGTSTLAQKFRFLSKLNSEEVRDIVKLNEVKKYLSRAKMAAQERNRYIHDQWVFAPDLIPQGRIRRSRYSSKRWDTKELSMSDLIAFRAELGELQKIFGNLIGDGKQKPTSVN